MLDEGITGRLRSAFDDNFQRGLEVGAAVAVWQDGREVVSLCGGWRDSARSIPWTRDTLVLIWSATKGLSSACVLHALEKAGLDLSVCVASFWPEFSQGGKAAITAGDVLSHQSGLSALQDKTAGVLDHAAVVAALEKQPPLWRVGEGHGYGPRTFGFLADEMVRRLSGKTLGEYWRKEFGDPMGLDLWIGLPASENARVADVLSARSLQDVEPDFARAMAEPGSLTREAFSSPSGALSPSAMNAPAMRSAALPSLGGIGSADSLAKFYAMLAGGGDWCGRQYFSTQALRMMTTRIAEGPDKTLCTPTAFSAGFMMDAMEGEARNLFGPSRSAFGHPGAGGSLAFADPENRIGFAYVMNQMEAGVLPKARALDLVKAVYNFL